MARRTGRRHDAKGRSEGDARFVQLPYWLLEAPATLALSGAAFKTLIYIAKRYNGSNNGKIGFGVRSGSLKRITGKEWKNTPFAVSRGRVNTGKIKRALDELQAAGFIVCTQEGRFDQKRLVREWRLTWLASGTANQHPPTMDYAVRNVAQIQKPVPYVEQSPSLQCHQRHYAMDPISPNDAYSITSGTIAGFHSATGGTHVVNQGCGEIGDRGVICAA